MSMMDVIFGPARILAVIITFFVCFFIWVSFTNVIGSSPPIGLSNSSQIALNQTISNVSIGFTTIDYMMPFIVVGMLIISLVFAFRTGASVVYAILSLIIWALALILSAVFTNIYLQFDQTMNLGTTFLISDYIMKNLKWIVLGWLAILTIVIFSRNKNETQSLASAEAVFG